MQLTFFAEYVIDRHLCMTRIKKESHAKWYHFQRGYWPYESHTNSVKAKCNFKSFQNFKSFKIDLPEEETICYYDEETNKFNKLSLYSMELNWRKVVIFFSLSRNITNLFCAYRFRVQPDRQQAG